MVGILVVDRRDRELRACDWYNLIENWTVGCLKICLTRFHFSWHRCLFFCPLLTNNRVHVASRYSWFPPQSSKWSSLIMMIVPDDILFFCAVCMHCKICPPHSITSILTWFCSFPWLLTLLHPSEPIYIHLQPSTPFFDHWPHSQNMMYGEISPTIDPKYRPIRP